MVSEDIEKEWQTPEKKKLKSGLYIVATPIGNLRDISLRALDTLGAADTIICEDTRVTRKLLSAYQIKARLQSYNDHSDASRREQIVSMVSDGQVVVLVSDAGMPLISDPGYKLIVACEEAGLYVTSIPGANAPLTALQLSAMPSDRFCFLGFLPNKVKARQDLLREWKDVRATLVAFEAPPRLLKALTDIENVLEDRDVAVVREITKMYEEVRRGKARDLITYYTDHGLPKGEIVLVIAPPEKGEVSHDDLVEMIRDALKTMRTKEASSLVAEKTGMKKNDVYALALEIGKEH
ncbi:MAG: 16S rRNA (cytidine(1402)-2'-O)-methyltransferase [Alphaproteobacteria bacterium]